MFQRVFVDSNVLFSRTTRDWLFLLRRETRNMFQVHSTIDVIAEVVRAVRREKPQAAGAVTRRLHDLLVDSLDEIVPDYDPAVPFGGHDRDDLHVHAAAMASGADILLTSNERDFGDTDELPYEIYAPDDFFVLVDDGAPDAVRRVVMEQIRYWAAQRRRGRSIRGLEEALIRAGCPEFAARVTTHRRARAGQ